MKTITRVGAVAAFIATVSGTFGTAAQAGDLHSATDRGSVAAPLLYENCTNLNKRFPHGLGRSGRKR